MTAAILTASGSLATRHTGGSGVILDPDGYIVTNAHVVKGARRVQVLISTAPDSTRRSILEPRGRLVGAQVIRADEETDLAVLKVQETGLPFLRLGDSDDLEPGQLVLAFGNPLGLETSVSLGTVSARARQLRPEHPMIYIQTDAANRYAYVSLGNNVGFEVIDLEQGEIIHRVLVDGEPILHRTHGAALTPDESELWISDQEGRKLFIFDNTQMPPVQTGEVDLSQGGHGWVTFSLDGRYVWTHTPDVFDAETKELVATLRDENGNPVSGSKFIEVHFRDGKVVAVGNEFGLGRSTE